MAGVTGLEPAASGVTGRYLRVMQGKLVAFVLNTAHRLPPIPTQKLEQSAVASHHAFLFLLLAFCSKHRKVLPIKFLKQLSSQIL